MELIFATEPAAIASAAYACASLALCAASDALVVAVFACVCAALLYNPAFSEVAVRFYDHQP